MGTRVSPRRVVADNYVGNNSSSATCFSRVADCSLRKYVDHKYYTIPQELVLYVHTAVTAAVQRAATLTVLLGASMWAPASAARNPTTQQEQEGMLCAHAPQACYPPAGAREEPPEAKTCHIFVNICPKNIGKSAAKRTKNVFRSYCCENVKMCLVFVSCLRSKRHALEFFLACARYFLAYGEGVARCKARVSRNSPEEHALRRLLSKTATPSQTFHQRNRATANSSLAAAGRQPLLAAAV